MKLWIIDWDKKYPDFVDISREKVGYSKCIEVSVYTVERWEKAIKEYDKIQNEINQAILERG